jgi:hypothetical protein
MQTKIRTARLIPAIAAALVAGAVLASVMTAPSHGPATTPVAPTASTTFQAVGTPTGELQQGVPVYRLPSIAVTASRSEELARMAREAALARN